MLRLPPSEHWQEMQPPERNAPQAMYRPKQPENMERQRSALIANSSATYTNNNATPDMGGARQHQHMVPQQAATVNNAQLSMKDIANIHHQSIELMSKLYAEGKLDDSSYLALCARQQDIMKQITSQNNQEFCSLQPSAEAEYQKRKKDSDVRSANLSDSIQPRSENSSAAGRHDKGGKKHVHSDSASTPPFFSRVDERAKMYNYCEVEFKRSRSEIFVSVGGIQIDDFVRVEADRGEDLGRVTRINVNVDEDDVLDVESEASSPTSPKDFRRKMTNGSKKSLKRILRKASREEMTLLSKKTAEETSVLEVCRTKVRQRKLSMKVIDAEFQFDRHKLTFFFESDRRIDFRELVRDLFAMYKTRIWLQQIEKKGKPTTTANPTKNGGSDKKKQLMPRAMDE